MQVHPDSPSLFVGLLGSTNVRFNDMPVSVSAPKQRQVLALLALHVGHVVLVPTLVEELWGEEPPPSFATTLQTYILHVRKALAKASTASSKSSVPAVFTHHNGYLLDAETCQTDVHEFSNWVKAGQLAVEAGDQRRASDEYARALRLWRGPALADVRVGRVLELEAAALEAARRAAVERRIEADLALGRERELVSELTLLRAHDDMNEKLCELTMLAMYRAGQISRALEEYRELRATLARELGVVPSPGLECLHTAMLARDPELASEQTRFAGT